MDPYIQYNKDSQVIGGAELDIIDTYAKAYGFMPKLRREPTYDSSSWDPRGEGETFVRGPVHKAGFTTGSVNEMAPRKRRENKHQPGRASCSQQQGCRSISLHFL